MTTRTRSLLTAIDLSHDWVCGIGPTPPDPSDPNLDVCRVCGLRRYYALGALTTPEHLFLWSTATGRHLSWSQVVKLICKPQLK